MSSVSVPALIIAALFAAFCSFCAAADAAPTKRLKRADSYLGIHFDFHAGPDCKDIGRNTSREMVEKIIDLVRPDYIQVDCKGHPGLSSYPTDVGNRAPGFVGDPLRVWREVTSERGVALYMHYSGVWDSEAIRKHPDWGAVNADGSINPNATSVFGPYADQLLIPQLRELNRDWGVDGAWVDGECWATVPDYGVAAVAAFRQATGIEAIPKGPREPHWREWLEFHREAFRKYLRRYIAAVKKTNPGMQLCSNWAFTDHMPERVSAPVDWISGDYSPSDSVNSARFSARYIANQGKPWDLMAWSFAAPPNTPWIQKSPVQLQREAAVVIALGGGFQAYFTQRRDGSVRLEHMPIMAEAARFCRARQPLCQGAKQVPQVALLYSTYDHCRSSDGCFPRDLSRISGTLQALVEGQQMVEVHGEHTLAGRMTQYPLIVIPEVGHLEPDFVGRLVAYARAGGSLLLVGSTTADLFGGLLIGQSDQIGDPGTPARSATVYSVGKGRIGVVPEPFSGRYLAQRSPADRDFLNAVVRRLFPNPLVEVVGSHDVDLIVNRVRGKLSINLINTSGPHFDIQHPIIEAIEPVGPLEVRIRRSRRPARVTLQPDGVPLQFEHASGLTRITVPRLEVHGIVVVE